MGSLLKWQKLLSKLYFFAHAEGGANVFGATGVGGTAGKATAGFVGVAADIAKDECKNNQV